ncbi:hypothetical protein MTY_1047 [Moorella thermoacetica Y72]|uniref:Uncharacterized protein n=1 Tax=Moorella thermoacetica Y72 TaxID=1325331 RepID=A0A0S6UB79_NEOTH|nr:hypothetical protein MTY_1047 [Moorella thermoacetica Y72]
MISIYDTVLNYFLREGRFSLLVRSILLPRTWKLTPPGVASGR